MLYYQSLSFFLKTIIRTATITAAARTPTAIYILPSPVADVSVVTADGTAVVVMVVVVVVVFAVPSVPVFPPLLEDAWEDDELEEEELCDEELDDEFEDELEDELVLLLFEISVSDCAELSVSLWLSISVETACPTNVNDSL